MDGVLEGVLAGLKGSPPRDKFWVIRRGTRLDGAAPPWAVPLFRHHGTVLDLNPTKGAGAFFDPKANAVVIGPDTTAETLCHEIGHVYDLRGSGTGRDADLKEEVVAQVAGAVLAVRAGLQDELWAAAAVYGYCDWALSHPEVPARSPAEVLEALKPYLPRIRRVVRRIEAARA